MIWKILTIFNLVVTLSIVGLVGMAVHNIKKKKKYLKNASGVKTHPKAK